MQRSGGVGVPHTLVNRCCPPPCWPTLVHTSSRQVSMKSSCAGCTLDGSATASITPSASM